MKVLITSVLAVVLVALAACDSTTTNVGEDAVEQGADIQVIDFEWGRTEFGSRSVTGTLRNTTDREMSYVSITFELTDKDGNTVGSAIDNVGSLSAGQTWVFEALVLEDRAHFARVSDVTAF